MPMSIKKAHCTSCQTWYIQERVTVLQSLVLSLSMQLDRDYTIHLRLVRYFQLKQMNGESSLNWIEIVIFLPQSLLMSASSMLWVAMSPRLQTSSALTQQQASRVVIPSGSWLRCIHQVLKTTLSTGSALAPSRQLKSSSLAAKKTVHHPNHHLFSTLHQNRLSRLDTCPIKIHSTSVHSFSKMEKSTLTDTKTTMHTYSTYQRKPGAKSDSNICFSLINNLLSYVTIWSNIRINHFSEKKLLWHHNVIKGVLYGNN